MSFIIVTAVQALLVFADIFHTKSSSWKTLQYIVFCVVFFLSEQVFVQVSDHGTNFGDVELKLRDNKLGQSNELIADAAKEPEATERSQEL